MILYIKIFLQGVVNMNDICNDNKTAEEIFKKRIEQNFKLFTQEEKNI